MTDETIRSLEVAIRDLIVQSVANTERLCEAISKQNRRSSTDFAGKPKDGAKRIIGLVGRKKERGGWLNVEIQSDKTSFWASTKLEQLKDLLLDLHDEGCQAEIYYTEKKSEDGKYTNRYVESVKRLDATQPDPPAETTTDPADDVPW